MRDKDESYIIDLCDEVLGLRPSRQYRFKFLLGDSGTKLPVDAYYKARSLVVEFYERQHNEPVLFFDKPDKLTCSGVPRGEQRKIYDQRRQEVLPENGIRLIILRVDSFLHDKQKRLLRIRNEDLKVVRRELAEYIQPEVRYELE